MSNEIEVLAGDETTEEVGYTHQVEADLPNADVVLDTSATTHVEPYEYYLTSGGIYTGRLEGGYPLWLDEYITDQLINNDAIDNNAIIQSILDRMLSAEEGIQQNLTYINDPTMGLAALETLIVSKTDDNTAAIENLDLAYTTADEALALSIDAIVAKFGTGEDPITAYIANVDTAIANASTAYASSYDILAAAYGDVNASVLINSQVIANQTEAIANRLVSIEAEAGSNKASVTESYKAYASKRNITYSWIPHSSNPKYYSPGDLYLYLNSTSTVHTMSINIGGTSYEQVTDYYKQSSTPPVDKEFWWDDTGEDTPPTYTPTVYVKTEVSSAEYSWINVAVQLSAIEPNPWTFTFWLKTGDVNHNDWPSDAYQLYKYNSGTSEWELQKYLGDLSSAPIIADADDGYYDSSLNKLYIYSIISPAVYEWALVADNIYAEASVMTEVNGIISGWRNYNDADQTTFDIYADRFRVFGNYNDGSPGYETTGGAIFEVVTTGTPYVKIKNDLLIGGDVLSTNYDWNSGNPIGFGLFSEGDPNAGYNIIGGYIYGGVVYGSDVIGANITSTSITGGTITGTNYRIENEQNHLRKLSFMKSPTSISGSLPSSPIYSTVPGNTNNWYYTKVGYAISTPYMGDTYYASGTRSTANQIYEVYGGLANDRIYAFSGVNNTITQSILKTPYITAATCYCNAGSTDYIFNEFCMSFVFGAVNSFTSSTYLGLARMLSDYVPSVGTGTFPTSYDWYVHYLPLGNGKYIIALYRVITDTQDSIIHIMIPQRFSYYGGGNTTSQLEIYFGGRRSTYSGISSEWVLHPFNIKVVNDETI